MTDGHEREDVKAYRNTFIATISSLLPRIRQYDGDDASIVIEPTIASGEKELVYIVHDESIFYSNDAKKFVWLERYCIVATEIIGAIVNGFWILLLMSWISKLRRSCSR